ncbi:hypothetical protein HDV03_003770 [Kappamyces sp. JEL0829]|nr:hypothetical protein HDV03_003770 [Kappamyces sp. JEL0829]
MLWLFLLYPGKSNGKPWHSINQWDAAGAQCPALPALSLPVSCPVLCVEDISQCPAEARPFCPAGTQYCSDQTCQTTCPADTISSCVCNQGLTHERLHATLLLPCLPIQTNISFPFHARPACHAKLNLSPDVYTPFFMQCIPDEHHGPETLFLTRGFVALFVYLGSQLLIVLGYWIYKRLAGRKERLAPNSFAYALIQSPVSASPTKSKTKYSTVGRDALQDVSFTGYETDAFGNVVYFSVVLTSLCWVVLMVVLTVAYYATLRTDRTIHVSYGTQDLLTKSFIVVWHLMAVWFLVLWIMSHRLEVWFLKQTPFEQAEQILVRWKRETPIESCTASSLSAWFQDLEDWCRRWLGSEMDQELLDVQYTNDGNCFIVFRCVRYHYDPELETFVRLSFADIGIDDEITDQERGLSAEEARSRLDFFGENRVFFPAISFPTALCNEFFGIFYLYQLMILLTWLFYSYYYMGLLVATVIVVAGITKVVVTRAGFQKVVDMATYSGTARVLRDAAWTTVPLEGLVVGDIVELDATASPLLGADCLVIEGFVVVDESNLTGESLPVTKWAFLSSRDSAWKSSMLYAGTYLLETKRNDRNALAMVTATGSQTERGKLVREILYPPPVRFVFTDHLKLAILILFIWGLFNLFFSIVLLDATSVDAWFYAIFDVSQVLSPVLPTVFIVSSTIAADRLRRGRVLCLDLNRIIMAGKIAVACFDKTGTLTKSGLEFVGCHEITMNALTSVYHRFELLNEFVQVGMQTCHSLSMLNGQVVGNFVDVEMFKATECSLGDDDPSVIVNPADPSSTVRIRKVYPFDHALGYMSCIAEYNGRFYLFVKGGFEALLRLAAPSSIPDNFVQVGEQHSRSGCYCIGLAMKELDGSELGSLEPSRTALERDMVLIGILLFRNDLKPDTPYELQRLREGGIRPVIITGDHISTAVYIANASGVLDVNESPLNPFTFVADYDSAALAITWTEFHSNAPWSTSRVEAACRYASLGGRSVYLCIGSRAFEPLLRAGWLEQHLDFCYVFARMNPMQKIEVVKLFMKTNVTMMVGDGGNDSGALKTCHVGLALSSRAESSVVSHFSSKDTSIASSVTLVREGRCSLDVSLACYKMLILYGQVLMINGLVQMYFMVQQSQGMWIVIDGSSFAISFCLLCARPARQLSPGTPTARLFGARTLVSVIGQIAINLGFCALAIWLLFSQSFFRCHEFDFKDVDLRRWWELADNFEAALTALLSGFQIISCAASFNLGHRFRQGFWRNWQFLTAFGLGFGFLTFLLVADPNFVGCYLRINCGTRPALEALGYSVPYSAPNLYYSPQLHNVFPLGFRIVVLGVVLLNLACLIIFELVCIRIPNA